MKHRTFSTFLAFFILCFALAGCSSDITVSRSADQFIGERYEEVLIELTSAGFLNITTDEINDLEADEEAKDGTISSISINGDTAFSVKSKFPPESIINITYHTMKKLPVPLSSSELGQMDGESVEKLFREAGFTDITIETIEDLTSETKDQEGIVQSIEVGGSSEFLDGDMFPCNAAIKIKLHTLKMIVLPLSSADMKGAAFSEINEQLATTGFSNINVNAVEDLTSRSSIADGTISDVIIMGVDDYDKGISLPFDADISITYHVIKKVNIPFSKDEVKNLNPEEIKNTLNNVGFANIKITEIFDMDPDLTESEYSNEIEINGNESFTQGEEYPFDIAVEIKCHRLFTKYTITAHVQCDANLIFSKYDVNVLFDGNLAGTIKHGKSSDFEFRAIEGAHTITFEKKDDSNVNGVATIEVTVDTEIAYNIHCTSDSVQINTLWEDKKIEIKADEIKIMFDAGTYRYKTITEVLEDFRSFGFTNITTKPIYDQYGSWLETDGEIESILIDGKDTFAPNDIFKKNVPISITYHTKRLSSEEIISLLNKYIGKNASEIFAALEGVKDTIVLSVLGEKVSNVGANYILDRGRYDSNSSTIYLEFLTKEQIELTTQLKTSFPMEKALRATVVALTNSQATDVFNSDGNTYDTSKFHSYNDISGFFMTIEERGNWFAKDNHTWHVSNILLKMFDGEMYLRASLDVSMDGNNYIVSDVYKTVGAKDKIDDGKTYTTEHINPSDSHPYLTVPASLIEEDRDESAVNAMISEKKKHEEWVDSQFSWWDGSHMALEELVKSKLNDESSFKHIKTVYVEIYDNDKKILINEILEKGGYSQRVDIGDLFIEMQFSAKNAFNATIKANAIGVADYSTNKIILVDILY